MDYVSYKVFLINHTACNKAITKFTVQFVSFKVSCELVTD